MDYRILQNLDQLKQRWRIKPIQKVKQWVQQWNLCMMNVFDNGRNGSKKQ